MMKPHLAGIFLFVALVAGCCSDPSRKQTAEIPTTLPHASMNPTNVIFSPNGPLGENGLNGTGTNSYNVELLRKYSTSMKPGVFSYLEFLDNRDAPWKAELTATDVHSKGAPWQTTDDPQWILTNLGTGQKIHTNWLKYMAPDQNGNRGLWAAYVHCEAQPPAMFHHTFGDSLTADPVNGSDFPQPAQSSTIPPGSMSDFIQPWFEHIYKDGGGDHQDVAMEFVAPDGKAWKAVLTRVRKWPAPPAFFLTQLTNIPVVVTFPADPPKKRPTPPFFSGNPW